MEQLADEYWIISYPRSGNTFIRYIIESLSGRKTMGNPPISSRVTDMGVDLNAPPIAYKTHTYNPTIKDSVAVKEGTISIKHYNNLNGMILVIRDYKECFPRHYKTMKKTIDNDFFDSFVNSTSGIVLEPDKHADYIGCIQAYDLRETPKLLIYYEDLIKDTESSVRKIAQFINCDADDFCKNIENHKIKSINNYGRSDTKGKTVSYHQESIDKKLLNKMSESLKERYPKIFKKYLKQYE